MARDRFELTTPIIGVDAMELDTYGDGIPPYLVEKVATNITRLLVQNGVDPNSVYYRGYEGEPEEINETARRLDIEGDPATWLGRDEHNPADDLEVDSYVDILGERDQKRQAQEDALGRQIDGPPNPSYLLGTYDSLSSDDVLGNPIHMAGVTEDESFIDVFDKAMIDALDPGQEEGITKVIAIPEEQLGMAAVGRIRLGYQILNDDIA